MSTNALLLISAVVTYIVLRSIREITAVRAEKALYTWARENGYTLREVDYRWYEAGPYFWSSILGGVADQFVYRVTVVDKEGWVMKGWVCCRGILGKITGEPVEVEWDRRLP